jgi:molybdopterin-guanine dinucleotide biosynthesis protein A
MKNEKKLPVSAIILAGGKGERVGGNKLFLSVDGVYLVTPMIEKISRIFDEILLCVGNGESKSVIDAFSPILQFYSVILIEDSTPGRGPIEGLSMGLKAMSNNWGFLIGCDMINPQEAVIHFMWSRTADLYGEYKVCAARFDNYIMPLHAFYHRDCSFLVNSSIEQAESECDAIDKESESRRYNERSSFNRKLRLKSFYCRTKINVIEEYELSIIPGWRKSFAGYNTDKELKSMLGF